MAFVLRFLVTFFFILGAVEAFRWLFFNRQDKEVRSFMKRWSLSIGLAVFISLLLMR